MARSAPPATPEAALMVMRVIGASLPLGVTLFALVSWLVHQQGGPGTGREGDPALIINVWITFAAVAAVAAVLLWRSRVAPILESPAAAEDWRTRAETVQTGAIISWALIEGAALFGVVIYFLYGVAFPAIVSVAMIWATLGLTWPKREWLEGSEGY